jgi:hypothetical protein
VDVDASDLALESMWAPPKPVYVDEIVGDYDGPCC